MRTNSYTAAPNVGTAAIVNQAPEIVPLSGVAQYCIQISHTVEGAGGNVKTTTVRRLQRVPHDHARRVDRIVFGSSIDHETGGTKGCYLFVFETPRQAKAWAKKLNRNYDRSLGVGSDCESYVLVTPPSPSNGLGNVVFVLGEALQWNPLLLRVIPTQNMNEFRKVMRDSFGSLWR